MNDTTDKPNRDTDPIGWLNWYKERQRLGAIRGNKTRPNRSEIAKKAWATKRRKAKK